jgi:conjugal transfer mating pair stabilization protein TraN
LAFEEEKCKITQTKHCVDYGEKIKEGYPTTQCWKYEQIETCISKEKNHCFTYEQNRNCKELPLESKCLDNDSGFGLCKNQEKKFVCGSKQSEQEETKHLGTDYVVIRNEKDLSMCNQHEIDQRCEVIDEICTEGPETRNIKGKDVHQECWRWEKKYICTNDSFINECREMASNCKEIDKTCLHTNPKTKTCDHYEHQYSCSENQTLTKECMSYKACHGGVCETKQRRQHDDFGKSISYLTMLASMKNNDMDGCKCRDGKDKCDKPGEVDPNSCKFFTGKHNECRKHTGHFNCCSEKGFVRQIVKCKPAEIDLHENRKAGFCEYLRTKKGKKLESFKSWQHYCCFKSKLAKIIQVEGRKQLKAKNHPNIDLDDSCRALTLDELKKIDFTKINFKDLFHDIQSKAKTGINKHQPQMTKKMDEYKGEKYSPGKGNPQNPLKAAEDDDKTSSEEIKNNLKTNADFINSKIHNFYSTGGGK